MILRTISQLPNITGDLNTQALLHISDPISTDNDSVSKYVAKKISVNDLVNLTSEKARDQLSHSYEYGELYHQISAIAFGLSGGTTETYYGEHTFDKSPTINEVLSTFNEYDRRAVNVDSMKNFTYANNPLFIDGNAAFKTSYFNLESNLELVETNPPATTDEKHNAYLFMVTNFESNVWTANESGIFTCYGWMNEEVEGNIDNSRRWVALEGYIGDGWKILQLQPFIHSIYCSYVGFTFPVDKGLKLRIKCGFKVGNNSNKYQSAQGSLTNHIANAFVGGIYKSQSFLRSGGNTSTDQSTSLTKVSENYSMLDLKDTINRIIDVLNGTSN